MPSRMTFAPAELAFVAVRRVVVLDLEHETRVTQTDAVAGGGTKHLGVMLAVHSVRHGGKF